MPSRYDVFVSHTTRPDADGRDFVDALVRELRALGLSVFLDREGLEAGRLIIPELDEIVEASDCGVLLMSRRQTAWQAYECTELKRRQNSADFPMFALRFDTVRAPPTGIAWTTVIDVDSSSWPPDIAGEIYALLRRR